MNERRSIVKKLGLMGAAAVAAVGSASAVQAAPRYPKAVRRLRAELIPHIQKLGEWIWNLTKQVEPLAQGEFQQLNINHPDGNNVLSFGETGECRIRVGPADGTRGLLLEDPFGVRIMPPTIASARSAGSPTLFFGPTDLCSISVNPGAGILFADPHGFAFEGGDTLIVSQVSDDGASPRSGVAFVDSFFDIDVECRGRVSASPDGMLFNDASSFRFAGGDIQALSTQDDNGELVPGGVAFVDSFFDIDVECRGRVSASPDGMLFNDASSFGFAGGDIQALSTQDADGKLVPGGIAFVDSFFDIDVECRGRISATAEGMSFGDSSFFSFDGPVAAQEFIQTSSGHLKENVRPISDALTKIQALQGVYFDWKPDQGGKPDIGFIGEAVNDVLPELVAEKAAGGVTGVKYANIVAVAVEGIKAQQSAIERLEAQNARLSEQLEAVQARLAKLG